MSNDDSSPPTPNAEATVPRARGLREAGEMDVTPPVVFQTLDPRVIHLWRLRNLISFLFFLLIAVVVGGAIVFNLREFWPWALGVLAAIGLLPLLTVGWIPPRSYRASGYRLDEKVLEVRGGIWFQVLTLLPLSRLQHVDLNRGPMERLFGLASLHLHTAGTEHSTITIEGLAEADAVRLRDHLVALGAGGDDAV